MGPTTQNKAELPHGSDLTPRAIVQALDRHIVGQAAAKKMVAIALRNRTRRQRLDEEMAEEVTPKNILMIGPTGIGKTEIARRLAKLVNAPFVKVEATKYTEVGYVGRDVESMVRDLVETAVKLIREERVALIRTEAERQVRERLIGMLEGGRGAEKTDNRRMVSGFGPSAITVVESSESDALPGRDEIARKLDRGEMEEREIEIEVQMRGNIEGIYGMVGVDEQMMSGMRDMLEKVMPQRSKRSRMTVAEARKVMIDQQIEEMLDMDKIQRDAIVLAEQSGIIFIDELDKIAGHDSTSGPDVSRQGVQRDILPIIEGCTVATKHGHARTDHILFIAAGAFHMSKPSDLIPELQGRFPLRVELDSLGAEEFKRILTEPQPSLIDQYKALLETDGVFLSVTPEAIDEIATSAATINDQTENIGARRLHTILERVLQDVAFDAPDAARGDVIIDREYVRSRLEELMKDQDLGRFIL